jgi:hypothetical protein
MAFELGAGGNQPISARIPVSAAKLPEPSGLTGGSESLINGKVGHR